MLRCTVCNRPISSDTAFDLCNSCMKECSDKEGYFHPEENDCFEPFDKRDYVEKNMKDLIDNTPDPLWDYDDFQTDDEN